MFRAAVKLPLQHAVVFILTRVRARLDPWPSPRLLSERAREACGPQRLCSLSPDTCAAVPPSWRSSHCRPFTNRTRRAR